MWQSIYGASSGILADILQTYIMVFGEFVPMVEIVRGHVRVERKPQSNGRAEKQCSFFQRPDLAGE